MWYRNTHNVMASSFGWGGVGSSVGPQDTPPLSSGQLSQDEPKTQSNTQQAKGKKEVKTPQSTSKSDKGKDANAAPQAQERAGSVQLRMDELSRRELSVAEREAHVKEMENKLRDGGIDIKPKNCESIITTILLPFFLLKFRRKTCYYFCDCPSPYV